MNNLNSILIEGNLVRDPVLRSTAKGTPLCTFSLASNRYYKHDSDGRGKHSHRATGSRGLRLWRIREGDQRKETGWERIGQGLKRPRYSGTTA